MTVSARAIARSTESATARGPSFSASASGSDLSSAASATSSLAPTRCCASVLPIWPTPMIAVVTFAPVLCSAPAGNGRVRVVINIAANGPVVMTERVDVFTLAGKTFDLRVMGAFEVNDGKINAWRDYFDPSQFNSQIP
jgi:Limonene-1,2-epoxide hydrolase catalytic domain